MASSSNIMAGMTAAIGQLPTGEVKNLFQGVMQLFQIQSGSLDTHVADNTMMRCLGRHAAAGRV